MRWTEYAQSATETEKCTWTPQTHMTNWLQTNDYNPCIELPLPQNQQGSSQSLLYMAKSSRSTAKHSHTQVTQSSNFQEQFLTFSSDESSETYVNVRFSFPLHTIISCEAELELETCAQLSRCSLALSRLCRPPLGSMLRGHGSRAGWRAGWPAPPLRPLHSAMMGSHDVALGIDFWSWGVRSDDGIIHVMEGWINSSWMSLTLVSFFTLHLLLNLTLHHKFWVCLVIILSWN